MRYKEHANSADPPPYTILLSLTRFLTTHNASCNDLYASSHTILLPPLTTTVTALVFLQPSTTNTLSYDVPNDNSLTQPANPNLSALISSNLGTILAPVAIANNSISIPPTHLTAGN